MRFNICLLLIGLLIGKSTNAQKSQILLNPEENFNKGLELFANHKYGSALHFFEKCQDKEEAIYYSSICAMELFNKDGEVQIKKFILNHPNSLKLSEANFYLGKYYFRKKKYKEALGCFNLVDKYLLTSEEKSEWLFKKGYANFELWDKKNDVNAKELAKVDFFEIKGLNSNYAKSAKYYYAHIAYSEKNFETALRLMSTLKEDDDFGPIVPYYITQMYYLESKYDSAIAYGTPLLNDTINTKRLPEIARIIGESYYRKGKFNDAIPFFKFYEKVNIHLNRQDQYQFGFAYYAIKNYEEAIKYLRLAVGENDSITQNAYYHIADCYLNLKNKQSARNAFAAAAKFDFNLAIQENALFNYAKLCYELSYNPFGEAIKAFLEYINKYPSSIKRDECLGYLANLYLTSGNYSEAIKSLEKVQTLKGEARSIYQKVTYYKSLDFYTQGKYDSVFAYIEKSKHYPEDLKVVALEEYWLAETYYAMKQYSESILHYTQFMEKPKAFGLNEYYRSNYNLGYAYMHSGDYSNANIAFRKFTNDINKLSDSQQSRLQSDALLRVGDTYFVEKDYEAALDYYTRALNANCVENDYALFQKGCCHGLLKNFHEKVETLQMLLSKYPNSVYAAESYLELGKAYVVLDNQPKAIEVLNMVVDHFPSSKFVNDALSLLGVVYFNNKQDDNALAAFDKLIRRDRKSKQAEDALATVKLIYLDDKKDVEGLDKYFQEIKAVFPMKALDSASFQIGNNAYKELNWTEATKGYINYLTKFPDGIFSVQAQFELAQSYLKLNQTDLAIQPLNVVKNSPLNEYSELVQIQLAEIYYNQQKLELAWECYKKIDESAGNAATKLLATIGGMHCAFLLNKLEEAMAYCAIILRNEGSSLQLVQEASLIKGKCLMGLNLNDQAIVVFKGISTMATLEFKVEAEYYIALLYCHDGKYMESKSQVFGMIKKYADYTLWVGRSLLVLSDDYIGLKDLLQAKLTLKSIIESSTDPALILEANKKLKSIEQPVENNNPTPE